MIANARRPTETTRNINCSLPMPVTRMEDSPSRQDQTGSNGNQWTDPVDISDLSAHDTRRFPRSYRVRFAKIGFSEINSRGRQVRPAQSAQRFSQLRVPIENNPRKKRLTRSEHHALS